MKIETHVISLQLIIVLNTFINVANALSNNWEGCTNKCQMDINFFCQQDINVCMSCETICGGGDSYKGQCETSCQGYMLKPAVENKWEGCLAFCGYDIDHFCDVSTGACMQCEHICNVTAKYYNQQQCSNNCAGYLKVQKKKKIQTTTLAVTDPPSVSLRTPQKTRYTVPDNANNDWLFIIVLVGISVACFITIITITICYLKEKRKRNQKIGDRVGGHIENGHPTEVRLNEGGVKVCLVNQEYVDEPAEAAVSPTLPYPHEETQVPSPEPKESSQLHEDGGPFRP